MDIEDFIEESKQATQDFKDGKITKEELLKAYSEIYDDLNLNDRTILEGLESLMSRIKSGKPDLNEKDKKFLRGVYFEFSGDTLSEAQVQKLESRITSLKSEKFGETLIDNDPSFNSINVAISHQAPLEMIEFLIEKGAAVSNVLEKDTMIVGKELAPFYEGGSHTVLCAVNNGASPELVKFLIDRSQKTDEGSTRAIGNALAKALAAKDTQLLTAVLWRSDKIDFSFVKDTDHKTLKALKTIQERMETIKKVNPVGGAKSSSNNTLPASVLGNVASFLDESFFGKPIEAPKTNPQTTLSTSVQPSQGNTRRRGS